MANPNDNANLPALEDAGDPFPIRLYNMLHSEDPQQREIVDFLAHGRAFRVNDRERFCNEVLPVWFNETDWEGFQHQLEIHGFQAFTQGRDEGAYYHERFLQGMLFLVPQIIPDPNGPPQRRNHQNEPNFYRMPILDARPLASEPPTAATSNIGLSALAPTIGNSALPPGTVGYPVLTRLLMPAPEGDHGVHSILLDNHGASDNSLHDYLRAAGAIAEQGLADQDRDQQEAKQETEAKQEAKKDDTAREDDQADDDHP